MRLRLLAVMVANCPSLWFMSLSVLPTDGKTESLIVIWVFRTTCLHLQLTEQVLL